MAQNVRLQVNGPNAIATGQAFKVEFSVNAKPESFQSPSFEGFDVLAGPTSSRFSNTVIANGKVEQTETYAYTFVLMANAPGVHTIPAAKVVVDGKEYTSRPLPIEAVAERQSPPQGGQQGGAETAQGGQQQTLASDDILLRVFADKTEVYKGQPVRVTMKLYSRVPIAGLENRKFPAFNGFWVQDLSVDHYTPQRETYNGKVYESNVLREYLVFPQQSGMLQVEQSEMTAVAQIVVQAERQSRSPFDDFFGGIPDIKQVSRRVAAPAVNITVKEWPAGAPDSFNGAVGNFTMTSEFTGGSVTANSSSNYTVKITGTGNLPLIQAPHLDMPDSFEQYNIKTTESLQRSAAGISGYRQFEYPLIARAEGDFSIEPVRFSYFDPNSAKYVTLTTCEERVTVLADSTSGRSASGGGLVSGLSKEDVRILGEDIRFIKLGRHDLSMTGRTLMGSGWYYGILALIIGGFVFALIYLQKLIEERRNAVAVRGKRANKVALQRLNAAQGYMKEGSQRNFYEEMLKALWGYIGDKLNIPAANLTKENVREGLTRHGVSAEQTARYVDLISECEYAQYSPAGSGQMQDIYRSGVELISKFESLIKK